MRRRQFLTATATTSAAAALPSALFAAPEPAVRKKEYDHTVDCLEQAYQLGIPTMRVNSGRWNTSKSFDELMANRGEEPPLAGYSEADAFPWVIEAYTVLAKEAEQRGVVMGLENHWGLGRTPEGVLKVVEAVGSPFRRWHVVHPRPRLCPHRRNHAGSGIHRLRVAGIRGQGGSAHSGAQEPRPAAPAFRRGLSGSKRGLPPSAAIPRFCA